MSHQHDKADSTTNTEGDIPSRPKADFKPPISILAKQNTTVEITSQKVSALDITKKFNTAASVLNTGQLVKDEYFTLFESVGALEIMDSKMDSGHLVPGETLEDDFDVLRNLLPEEVIGIIDQILCHEVAWHMGHPLSQTLFTSLYIERLLWPEPKTLEQSRFSRGGGHPSEDSWLHQALRSYCLATIKACYFVHSMVTAESFYEEEDFTSQLYHRELLPRVPLAEIETLLDDSLSNIATANAPPEMKKAIEKRLLFRRSILKALVQDTGPLKSRSKSSLVCVPLLQDVKDTSHLGVPVNESFSTKIQRSLASSVPPRPMVTIKFADALSYLETLCNDTADIDQILETESSEELFNAIWVFMTRVPRPSVYVRAVVQSFLLDRETQRVLGKYPPKQFLLSSIAAIVLPNSSVLDPANDLVEAPTSPRFQIARLIAQFDDKTSQQYLNVFRNACLNRCRTRRTLCHLVMDWDALQADAEDLDATIQKYTKEQPTYFAPDQPTFSYPLSSWVYHHKLNHVRTIIQMGFELTIYAPDEIAGMYWYLSATCGTHISHIDRITIFLHRDVEIHDSLPQKPEAGGKSEVEYRAAFQRTMKNLLRMYTHLKATDAFSRALHALHTLLLRQKAIQVAPRPYSSDKLRYELRMRPFLSLNVPEPTTFEIFQEESSFADINDEQVLEEADLRITEARKLWEEVLKQGWSAELGRPGTERWKGTTTIEAEWTKTVKDVIRACIATSISVATLKKRLDKKGDLTGIKATIPNPGEKDCWHDWWIVPKLSEIA